MIVLVTIWYAIVGLAVAILVIASPWIVVVAGALASAAVSLHCLAAGSLCGTFAFGVLATMLGSCALSVYQSASKATPH